MQNASMAAHEEPAVPASVLPWMRLPISIPGSDGGGVPVCQVHGLHPALRAALPFPSLFPVQAVVWRSLAGGHCTAHDLCICAPTGSGKTLAYALPLLNAIAGSSSSSSGGGGSRCRSPQPGVLALVVLPTRDLAAQVHTVLAGLAAPAGITFALAAAQQSVAAEAAQLAALPSRGGRGPQVLVATPGRLMAHLQSSPGFNLARLRFLVVDEADRLLRQEYHGWLSEVLRHTHHTTQHQQQPGASALDLQQPAHALSPSSNSSIDGSHNTEPSSSRRVVKLIVSATLTRNPGKLLRLELAAPRFISLAEAGGGRRYALPAALQQHRLVVPAQHKPLALLALLHQLAGSTVIVFASSLETTHRLFLLLQGVPGLPDRVAEYSSLVAAHERSAALAAFKAGRLRVLVTSDAMARGMDLPGVTNVISYDPPTFPKTYIHRAGRTARGGAGGSVFTLLKPEDVTHFNALAAKLQGPRPATMKLQQEQLQRLRPALQQALQHVDQLLQLERQQEERGGTAAGGAAAAAAAGGSRPAAGQGRKRSRNSAAS